MGGWERNANWDCDVLERIAVLLFALAGLADLAADAPVRRRRQVLGILSHGEVEARAFVVGMVCSAPVPADALDAAGDAMRLATHLRALALVLCVMLARRFAPPGAAGRQTGGRRPAGSAGRQAPPPAPDTS